MNRYRLVGVISSTCTTVLVLGCLVALNFDSPWVAGGGLLAGIILLGLILPSKRTVALEILNSGRCPRCDDPCPRTPHGSVEFCCRACHTGYTARGKEAAIVMSEAPTGDLPQHRK